MDKYKIEIDYTLDYSMQGGEISHQGTLKCQSIDSTHPSEGLNSALYEFAPCDKNRITTVIRYHKENKSPTLYLGNLTYVDAFTKHLVTSGDLCKDEIKAFIDSIDVNFLEEIVANNGADQPLPFHKEDIISLQKTNSGNVYEHKAVFTVQVWVEKLPPEMLTRKQRLVRRWNSLVKYIFNF